MQHEFPLANIHHIPRKQWQETSGMQHLRHYTNAQYFDTLETDVSSKFLCLSAFAALLDTLEKERVSILQGTLRVAFMQAKGIMLLDPSTVANLELVRNLRTGDPRSSLFGILNLCLTAAGTRYLRSAILQPSTDLATIAARLDAVSELRSRDAFAAVNLRKVLPTFADSDRTLKFFMQRQSAKGIAKAKASITAVLQLRTTLRAAPLLAEALAPPGEPATQNDLLVACLENVTAPEIAHLDALIDATLHDEATYPKRASQRILEALFAVRADQSHPLDKMRQRLAESNRDMDELLSRYMDDYVCAPGVLP